MHIHGIVRGDNIMPTQVIDLFCGIGGLTRGLLDAGLNVIAGYNDYITANRQSQNLIDLMHQLEIETAED